MISISQRIAILLLLLISILGSFLLLRNDCGSLKQRELQESVITWESPIQEWKPTEKRLDSLRVRSKQNLAKLEAKYISGGDGFIWGARGLPWLYVEKGMILGGLVRSNFGESSNEEFQLGKFTLHIYDLSGTNCVASNLAIWSRVTGAETISGRAVPHATNCEWFFQFQITVPGKYVLESKVLTWNGAQDVHYDQCKPLSPAEVKELDSKSYIDFSGKKFYSEQQQCCEVCTRMKNCTHWQTPGHKPGMHCSFYNSNEADTESFRRKLTKTAAFGTSRQEPTKYFLGCGWSFSLGIVASCVDHAQDDLILLESPEIIASSRSENPESKEEALERIWLEKGSKSSQALCGIGQGTKGRWVDLPESVAKECQLDPIDRTKNVQGSKFPMKRFEPGDDGVCWMQEDIIHIAERCLEGGCQALKDKSLWRNSQIQQKAKREGGFKGYWVPYDDCRYHYLTQNDYQKCATEKGLAPITTEGASIAEFFREYIKVRNIGIKFNGTTSTGGKHAVTVSTLRLPHLIWHNSYQEMRAGLRTKPPVLENETKFFFGTMFISSEREAHVVDDRGLAFTELSREILLPKGWKELSWHDSSGAFTYDTATQGDGLHIVGPPMKLLWTMVMNELCQGVSFDVK